MDSSALNASGSDAIRPSRRAVRSARRGSGAAKVFADINGVRQGMFVQCDDPGRPVLLCLHGGLPEFFMTERYPTGLEHDFTVVWWEQRGMGLSFSPDIPPETMSTEQFIADTLALTRYLRARFGKEKIYLMAHSGGTFFAVQAAARAPELYYAYIGVAQAVRQLESERLAQEYMIEQFRQRGDRRMVRRLASAPVTASGGTPRKYLAVRDRAMHRLGVGTTYEMKSVLSGLVWPSITSSAYTPAEKVRLWRGKLATGVSALWTDMLATNMSERVPELSLPAYFFHGIHDYTVSYQLAKEYVSNLRAPLKGFYTFSHSAHSPIFEEPDKARRILRENVLAGTNDLADDRR
jgi:pimeloyl-ACP methyl ester carboxylesterase